METGSPLLAAVLSWGVDQTDPYKDPFTYGFTVESDQKRREFSNHLLRTPVVDLDTLAMQIEGLTQYFDATSKAIHPDHQLATANWLLMAYRACDSKDSQRELVKWLRAWETNIIMMSNRDPRVAIVGLKYK